MSETVPILQSIELQPSASPAEPCGHLVAWEPDPHGDVEAYVFCRLKIPIAPSAAGGLFAGGLDLMLQRVIVPASVVAVHDSADTAAWPHRLVLARSGRGELRPVAGLRSEVAGTVSAPQVGRVGVTADHWTSPAPALSRDSVNAARVGASGRSPTYIERPMTVVEGTRAGAAARKQAATRHASPLEAWNKQVKPRMERGGRLPDLAREASVPKADAHVAEDGFQRQTSPLSEREEGPGEARAPLEQPSATVAWVILGSDALTMHPSKVRAGLRLLRGHLRVGIGGQADRARLQRRADRIDVPLDGIFAMEPTHPNFITAVGCAAAAVEYWVCGDDEAPTGVRVRRVEVDAFADAVSGLIADVSG